MEKKKKKLIVLKNISKIYDIGETQVRAVGGLSLEVNKGDFVAMEILNISEILKKILSKVINASKIKEIKMDIINFRNIDRIKFKIIADGQEETANFLIIHIRKKSPVLSY